MTDRPRKSASRLDAIKHHPSDEEHLGMLERATFNISFDRKYLRPSLPVDFKYKSPVEAARTAVDTAERYLQAGIPGMACGGGPALYRAEEEALMGLGVELVHAQGCEFFGYERVWIDTFNLVMSSDRSLSMPAPYEHLGYGTARNTVFQCIRHQRHIEAATTRPGNVAPEFAFTLKEYENSGYTPYTWMLRSLEKGYQHISTPFEKE